MTARPVARKLHIKGIVQGVGFRPFIYQLARRYKLAGRVANTSCGVTVHVEGAPLAIETFCREVMIRKPMPAYITDITEYDADYEGLLEFTISASQKNTYHSTLVSPDIATCDDCLKEMFDVHDRRFRYPFINCTNCGPRYTIIDDIPYDRPSTSMKHFTMCDACRTEYEDPSNRRFHAQPNACPACGPRVSLYDRAGRTMEGNDPVADAVRLLKSGQIVAIKGLGGFHLAADATNSEALQTLRQRKPREAKPFALMSPSLTQIGQYAILTPEEKALLVSPVRPIVLARKRAPNPIASEVSPKNQYFGVMLPYTPLHHLIMSAGFTALVMTSGNRSDEPISIDNDDAMSRLAGIADAFLMNNREIYLRSDDSIVFHAAGDKRLIRRSRGFIPAPVFLKNKVPQILACGGELKNTICLTKGDHAFLSQHIGDMENARTLDFFYLTVAHMKRILDISPVAIAFDMHPDYMSSQYASAQKDIVQIPVQHHHAHVVSCMAENHLDGEVIGLSFDGTGYGTDGCIWGGEVMIATHGAFDRAAHLSYVPMPGGSAAIKEPWRMAAAYLMDAYGDDYADNGLTVFDDLPENTTRLIAKMMSQGVNSPLTSSLGRLFDGVAAITGIRKHVHFEGQAAMALEMAAKDDERPLKPSETYPYLLPPDGRGSIPVHPLISGVVRDMREGVSVPEISTRFHWTIIYLFADLCRQIREKNGLHRVVLSGGVFQNVLLLKGLTLMLVQQGFSVYTHRIVPSNDGGLSLGQAVAAAAIIKTHNAQNDRKFP